MNKKVKIARLSVLSNTILIILKIIAGIYSGSVSIISEAIHSTMDLIAAIIAYFSVRVSDNPPDKDHPYGHGKYENISGVIEALLIFIAAIWIIWEAVEKILHPQEIDSVAIGTIVMLISAAVNLFVSNKLYKVAKETDSVALEADALHLKTDVYTSLGVSVGLILIWITKIELLDPIVAILVALLILKESFHLLKRAFNPLVDFSLSSDELAIIENTFNELSLKYHNLRTRKAGNYKFADMHLELPSELPLEKAHQICDSVEETIKKRIPNLEINIHIEPENSK